jgi:hypothetical protein
MKVRVMQLRIIGYFLPEICPNVPVLRERDRPGHLQMRVIETNRVLPLADDVAHGKDTYSGRGLQAVVHQREPTCHGLFLGL